MLKTLEKVQPDDAEDVLSALIDSLLPTPEPELVAAELAKYGSLTTNVLHEAYHRLHLKRTDPSDLSEKAKSRVLDLLSDEMTGYTLDPKTKQEARARLGQRGEIPPALYEVRFDERAWDFLNHRYKIEQHEIRDVLKKPDNFEHIVTPETDNSTGSDSPISAKKTVSLYTKNVTRNGKLATLLVSCVREGYTQTVAYVWLVFNKPGEDLSKLQPSFLLESFINRFGVVFQFSGGAPTKFVRNQAYEIPELKGKLLPEERLLNLFTVNGQPLTVESVRNSEPLLETHSVLKWTLSTGSLFVTNAFIFNRDAYEDDLRSNGMRIPALKRSDIEMVSRII